MPSNTAKCFIPVILFVVYCTQLYTVQFSHCLIVLSHTIVYDIQSSYCFIILSIAYSVIKNSVLHTQLDTPQYYIQSFKFVFCVKFSTLDMFNCDIWCLLFVERLVFYYAVVDMETWYSTIYDILTAWQLWLNVLYSLQWYAETLWVLSKSVFFKVCISIIEVHIPKLQRYITC